MTSSRFLKALATVLVFLAYGAVGLSSLRLSGTPRRMRNGAVSVRGDGLRFASPGLVRTPAAPPWVRQAVEESYLEVELIVRAQGAQQIGPARIFTLSNGPSLRNLTLGQEGSDLVVRLRTPQTNLNGLPAYKVPSLFSDKKAHEILVAIEGTKFRIEVDGNVGLGDDLPEKPLADWDPEYPVILGNEVGGQRPWLGEIERAVVRVRGRSFDYAQQEDLEIPEYFLALGPLPGDRYATERSWVGRWMSREQRHDWMVNLLGFVPLGCFLSLLWRRLSLTTVVALCALLSLSIELVQLLLPGRAPQISDLVLNTLGGAVGAWLGRGITALPLGHHRDPGSI